MTTHRFTWLIFSSLILLGVFEALWLGQVWNEQKDNLQQERDYWFQRTVATLQDSLVRRNLEKSNLCKDTNASTTFSTQWQPESIGIRTPPPRALKPPSPSTSA